MTRDQIDNLANLTELPMDPEKQSDISNKSKIWIAKDRGLKAGGKKDKWQSESCSIC